MSIGRRASRVANSLHTCEFNRFEAVVRPRPQMARHVVRGRHLAAPRIAGLGRAVAVCIADLGGESQVRCHVSGLRATPCSRAATREGLQSAAGEETGVSSGSPLKRVLCPTGAETPRATVALPAVRLVQPHLRGAVATAHLRWEVSLERVADGATDGARAADAAK